MGIRIVCIIVAVLVPGWWRIIPILGAVFLPYFAVIVANAKPPQVRGRLNTPGALVRRDASRTHTDYDGSASTQSHESEEDHQQHDTD